MIFCRYQYELDSSESHLVHVVDPIPQKQHYPEIKANRHRTMAWLSDAKNHHRCKSLPYNSKYTAINRIILFVSCIYLQKGWTCLARNVEWASTIY